MSHQKAKPAKKRLLLRDASRLVEYAKVAFKNQNIRFRAVREYKGGPVLIEVMGTLRHHTEPSFDFVANETMQRIIIRAQQEIGLKLDAGDFKWTFIRVDSTDAKSVPPSP